jgi:Mycothiol maleylpyruvate isomerase N-terminal domain
MEWIQVTGREDAVTALGFDRFAAELRAEADAFASTVDGADLALQVPTCPEWTLEQLVHHVGRAYYWATAIITSATATFIPFESVPEAVLPEQPGKVR